MEGTADFGGVGMGWGGWGREDKMSVRGGQFQELWVSEQLNHELANPPPCVARLRSPLPPSRYQAELPHLALAEHTPPPPGPPTLWTSHPTSDPEPAATPPRLTLADPSLNRAIMGWPGG